MSTKTYAADPSHLRWSGAVLTINNSDASDDPERHPRIEEQLAEDGSERISFYSEAEEEVRRLWLGKIANYIVYESGMQLSKDRKRFIMSDFPEGYKLYTHYMKRPGDAEFRLDSYLMGSTTKGCSKFRSPEEFAMHAKWLACGSPEGQCGCCYCSKTKQGDISKRLKKVTQFIKNYDYTKPNLAASHSAHTRVPSSGGNVKVMAKDYTQIDRGLISIWRES